MIRNLLKPITLILCAFLMVLVGSKNGLAQEHPQLDFSYQQVLGGVQCPGEASMKLSVAARLGYNPWNDDASSRLDVSIHEYDAHLEASLKIIGENGEITGDKVFRNDEKDCAELSEVVELAIAIVIDPVAQDENSEDVSTVAVVIKEKPIVVEETAAKPILPKKEEVVSSPSLNEEPSKPLWIRLSAGIGGALALGAAPSATGVLTAHVQTRFRVGSLGLLGRVDFPSEKQVEGGTLRTSQVLAGVIPCLYYKKFMGCAVVAAGMLRASGHDLVNVKQKSLPSAHGGARLGVEIPVGSVLLIRLYGDILAAISRNTITESGTDYVFWSTPPISGILGISLGGIFFDSLGTSKPIVEKQ